MASEKLDMIFVPKKRVIGSSRVRYIYIFEYDQGDMRGGSILIRGSVKRLLSQTTDQSEPRK